jgi:hypothetical protein
MNKSQKKTMWIAIVLLIVVMGGVLITFKNQIFQSALMGGTILSISSVNLLSSDSELSGKAYLVNVVVNGGGESISGTITPEQIQSFGIKEIPAGDFTLEMELLNYSCNYNLNNDDKTIYKIMYASTGSGCLAGQPPYKDVSIDLLKGFCKTGVAYDINQIAPNKLIQGQAPVGGNCDNMIHINKLASWTPEETNIVGGDVICYLHDCDAQRGTDAVICRGGSNCNAYRQYVDDWARTKGWDQYSSTLCCVSHASNGVNVGNSECPNLDGSVQGDWVVTEIGGIPFYQGYKIDTATQFDYVARITIKSPNGQQVVGVITPTQTSANLNNVAIAKFVGNLLNNQMCPVPAVDNIVVKDVVTQQMKVVDKNDYNQYVSTLDNLVRLDIDHYVFTYRQIAGKVTRVDPAVGGDVIFEQMSNLNNKLTNMVNQKGLLSDCVISQDQTQLVCSPDVIPTYPEIQLKIRADWLGVYTPVGKPVILAVDLPVSVTENTFAQTSAKIRNDGETDTFDIVYNCGTGSSSQVPIRESIGKAVSKTVTVPLFATYGMGRCVLSVVSVNDASKTGSYTVNVMVQQAGVITDVLGEQTLLKQQLLDEMSRLQLQMANASATDKAIITEQVNQLALRMQGLLNEQKSSTTAYQSEIDKQIALLELSLQNADITQSMEIQRQIDGLKSQQTQINNIVLSNADLNKELQVQIDKGLSQQKQIDLLTSKLMTVSYTVYIIIGLIVVGGVGYFFYRKGQSTGKRRKRR